MKGSRRMENLRSAHKNTLQGDSSLTRLTQLSLLGFFVFDTLQTSYWKFSCFKES